MPFLDWILNMTDHDMLDWYEGLGPTSLSRKAVVYDLLRHARGDEMSLEDRVICRRVLHGDLCVRADALHREVSHSICLS